MNYDAIEVPLEGNKEHKLCCCQPELTHDETMKLKLLFNQGVKEYGDEVIFDSLMPGIVKYINNNFYGNVIFQDIAVIGQNKLIYEMVTAFTRDNKRIIYLCGDSHTGKTSIAKHLANYMYERHKFADVRYLDMKTKTIHNFLAGIHGYENMYEKKDTDILVILDNMDQILRDEWTHYTEKMQERVEQSKMKFLVTCCSKELIKYSPHTSQRVHQTHLHTQPAQRRQTATQTRRREPSTRLSQCLQTARPWCFQAQLSQEAHC
jgi:hypothetical protein